MYIYLYVRIFVCSYAYEKFDKLKALDQLFNSLKQETRGKRQR